mmetsp:Transcript_27939/g.38430  ORF Transcript_27939/g.38430 Transcript_27939/m.38430 type:complete len:339 (+) Transcript_27939:144-1160(+)
MDEENDLMIDHFEKLEPSLENFDFPESTLWIKKVDKNAVDQATHTNKLIAEYTAAQEMMKERPDDKNLKAFVDRLTEQLAIAHKKEAKAEVTNPLQAAIEFMALTEEEVDKWIAIYAQIDKKRVGKVIADDIFTFIRETPTPFAKEIFVLMDAEDAKGKIEFGDFMRAIGTYCFFGKKDILKLLYVYVDKNLAGFITKKQFTDFLDALNPYEKDRVWRALKSLQLPNDAKIIFENFVEYNEKFPALFLPAFFLQNSMRSRIMGTDWWFEKLSKYRNVREKMSMEGAHAHEVVTQELERFKEDEEKNLRMARREEAIKQETSEVRKVILQARQFLDEYS